MTLTRDEILALSGEVVSALWPKWWTLGQTCVNSVLIAQEFDADNRDKYHCRVCNFAIWSDEDGRPTVELSHAIPPPDLTEPTNFLQALKLVDYPVVFERGTILIGNKTSTTYSCTFGTHESAIYGEADTPQKALLLALVDYVRRR